MCLVIVSCREHLALYYMYLHHVPKPKHAPTGMPVSLFFVVSVVRRLTISRNVVVEKQLLAARNERDPFVALSQHATFSRQ